MQCFIASRVIDKLVGTRAHEILFNFIKRTKRTLPAGFPQYQCPLISLYHPLGLSPLLLLAQRRCAVIQVRALAGRRCHRDTPTFSARELFVLRQVATRRICIVYGFSSFSLYPLFRPLTHARGYTCFLVPPLCHLLFFHKLRALFSDYHFFSAG